MRPISQLEVEIRAKAMLKLKRDGLLFAEEIMDRGSPYFNDRPRFAMDRYEFDMCCECKKPFYVGTASTECEETNTSPETVKCQKCISASEEVILGAFKIKNF
ncbi:hypothetical protein DPMN_088282 [Dreissena polymorpha]|uniref:Uncharacterized protein n=1 Tax=Dreissena polymorpha TaxID=45954 RepID=A0A9D4QX58_DREPO|nr:hypothetical protein DPMN_088282 [Dreissena polymorpha]